MDNLALIILSTLGLSIILNSFFKRFNIDTIIGYIFTGAIITTVFSLKRDLHLESLRGAKKQAGQGLDVQNSRHSIINTGRLFYTSKRRPVPAFRFRSRFQMQIPG